MQIRNRRVSWLILASLLSLGLAVSSSPLSPAAPRQFTLDLVNSLSLADSFRPLAEMNAAVQTPTEDLSQAPKTGDTRAFSLFGPGDEQLLYRPLPLSVPFGRAIDQTAERYELDNRLLAAIVEAESNFNPGAVSPRGAVGLTQILPGTYGGDGSELHDPKINLDAGARYLRQLLDQYEGNTELALAAYNAGPGRVKRYGGVPPFSETQRYVGRVLDLYDLHKRGDWRNEGDSVETR